jgi:hypothetical protein
MNTAHLSHDREASRLARIEPCDHVLHVYENDGVFLDTLEGFVSGGFRGGETVVVIATAPHLYALDYRLKAAGRDVDALRLHGQYITLDARDALDSFLVDGFPDDSLFAEHIIRLIETAQVGGKRVRAFGEMVALLWAEGSRGATLRLEQMWNTLCRENGLSLFCAYPRDADGEADNFDEIRALHSHVITTREENAA